MVFTEQQLQVKKLVDVQQDIEIDALNDGVGALSSTMQNGFTEAANNFSDIQNSIESMNTLSNERYNGVTGSVNTLSNAMTQGFLDMGNTVANIAESTQSTFNQINANISNSINNLNEQITNNLSVKELSVDTMIYNVSATPVSSLTALGYDSNGKVIPVTVIANQNVVLPENANYIYTDLAGTPYAGMADTAVSTNENLVTSHAVYNAVSDIWTDLNGFHNEVNNSFGDVQNSFNAVDNNFNGIQNQFNDVNSTFAGVQNQFNDVNNNFNGVQSQFNDVNNNISDIDNTLYDVMDGLGVYTPMNYINSANPVNYQAVQTVVFTKGNIGNLWSESSSLGNKYYDWNSSTNTLTFSSPMGIIVFNSNMVDTFASCVSLNQNIHIPNGVTSISGMFRGCNSLNQNIFIPNGITDIGLLFEYCDSLNQNIRIPEGVTDMNNTFFGCYNLNQNIRIPEGVINMQSTFAYCKNLNQNIQIPSTVLKLGISALKSGLFEHCSNLNQNITIHENATSITRIFQHCTSLNQDIYIYSDKLLAKSSGLRFAFNDCPLLATRNIHIRSTIPMDTSNDIYNALVNNNTGINWTGRIYNDL